MGMRRGGGDEEERYLAAREHLVTSVRHHPGFLWRPALETLGAVLVLGVLEVLVNGGGDLGNVGWMVLFVVVARLAVLIYDWRDIRFMITDRRLIRVHGLLVKKVNTMPLTEVTDLTYRRSGAGMLLGYGTFVVESAGQEHGLREIHFLPEPDALYAQLCDMMFGGGPPPHG